MPRWLLFFVFVIVQAYKGLIFLKDELINGLVYFVGLGPAALARKLTPSKEKRLLARKSSWIEIGDKGTNR